VGSKEKRGGGVGRTVKKQRMNLYPDGTSAGGQVELWRVDASPDRNNASS
jgi:hypothetical protein